MAAEEKTKNLVYEKLHDLYGEPGVTNQNGVTWYKEDTYKGVNPFLDNAFSHASKAQNNKNGQPDFTIIDKNTVIVVECKKSIDLHSRFKDINEYKKRGYGDSTETQKYAIDGALWYAYCVINMHDKYDVVALAVSGQSRVNSKVTSFLWPRNYKITDVELDEQGNISNCIDRINFYENKINNIVKPNQTKDQIEKYLKQYTLKCANFLRANGIDDNSKAGFISAIILGLTNEKSELYNIVKDKVDELNAKRIKLSPSEDTLGGNSVKLLKEALEGKGEIGDPAHIDGIWDIDGIPQGKRRSLKQYYDPLLGNDDLQNKEINGCDNTFFPRGKCFLSTCIFSLYSNIIQLYKDYKDIDIMGEFYTTFLRFTKGNAKEKGIVLTPKHITTLFCDLAEFFSGQKMDENSKILDICTGTGAFLIAALHRIEKNIDNETISEKEKKEKIRYAQKNSLIGVEKESQMYSLAYANMRFHGDGKSNLFKCSSLVKDSYFNDNGKTYDNNGNLIPLAKALQQFGDIDFGFINPPYSLKKDSALGNELDENKLKGLNDTERGEILINTQQTELDFVASMLHYLKKGGIGIAIVPMQCAGNSKRNKPIREKILKYHSLLAVMTMPGGLFADSNVSPATCIMVFKAHVPHSSDKETFFARWTDDGFKIIPHNGRKETPEWNNIHDEWMSELKPSHAPEPYNFIWQSVSRSDECLAEAYIKADYSKLTDDDFIRTLKKYALFKYMTANGVADENSDDQLYWLLENYDGFSKEYASALASNNINLNDRPWKEFKVGGTKGLFDVCLSKGDCKANELPDGDIPLITSGVTNSGIAKYIADGDGIAESFPSNTITVDMFGHAFYRDFEYFAVTHGRVLILLPKFKCNPSIGNFLVTVLEADTSIKYQYSRMCSKSNLPNDVIKLPINDKGEPDWDFMNSYIDSKPFSKCL